MKLLEFMLGIDVYRVGIQWNKQTVYRSIFESSNVEH